MPTILAIDDNEIALMARKKLLERAGYRVLAAQNTDEAIRLFDANPVHLVLMDYYLPRASGDLRKRMKAANPAVPIVILSGVIELPEDMSYADRFLSKLDGPDSMLATITELLLGPHDAHAAA